MISSRAHRPQVTLLILNTKMLSARKQSEDEGDGGVGYASAQKRIKIENASRDNVKKIPSKKLKKCIHGSESDHSNKRLKDVEICVPIVYGTMAFWLGRKASEYQSHKWTVYVRGASNEDLGAVIKRVEFQLHPSFSNPLRVVESPPFELSECGWGEFEIAISLFFHSDVCDKKLALYHHLKLYSEDESGPSSTKKPVVVESYDEIVFPDPSEVFFARVQNHPVVSVPRIPATFDLPLVPIEDVHEKKRGDTKDHFLSQWFMNFSDADELLKLAAVRQQVQAYIFWDWWLKREDKSNMGITCSG
ncbi:unnamed protein product [Camellia sinensis]